MEHRLSSLGTIWKSPCSSSYFRVSKAPYLVPCHPVWHQYLTIILKREIKFTDASSMSHLPNKFLKVICKEKHRSWLDHVQVKWKHKTIQNIRIFLFYISTMFRFKFKKNVAQFPNLFLAPQDGILLCNFFPLFDICLILYRKSIDGSTCIFSRKI